MLDPSAPNIVVRIDLERVPPVLDGRLGVGGDSILRFVSAAQGRAECKVCRAARGIEIDGTCEGGDGLIECGLTAVIEVGAAEIEPGLRCLRSFGGRAK